jgi:hypothetical protein
VKFKIIMNYFIYLIIGLWCNFEIPIKCNEMEISLSKSVSWINPKLELRSSGVTGKGIFAKQMISKNERLAVFGGVIVTKEQILQLDKELIRYVMQIEDDLWLASGLLYTEDADYINHSCQPNAGIKGQIMLVAMRDIAADEEITFDYAMCVGEFVGMQEFACYCGSDCCRQVITQNDWQIKELHKKYSGYFSHYLASKIKKLYS